MNLEQEIKTALGDRIKELREAKGLSQMEVAYRCEMSMSHLSKIENGHTAPGVLVMVRLAKALGISFTEIGSSLDPFTQANK